MTTTGGTTTTVAPPPCAAQHSSTVSVTLKSPTSPTVRALRYGKDGMNECNSWTHYTPQHQGSPIRNSSAGTYKFIGHCTDCARLIASRADQAPYVNVRAHTSHPSVHHTVKHRFVIGN